SSMLKFPNSSCLFLLNSTEPLSLFSLLLFRLSSYISYRRKAVGAHGLHSPFLFKLYNEVLKPAKRFSLQNVEGIRKQLKQDHKLIDLYDLKTGEYFQQTISSVAKRSLSKRKFSSFLFLLSNFLSVETILETGTSLGVNALYLAGPEKVNRVVTIEASPILASIAKKQFSKLLQHKIEIIQGTIAEKLEYAIAKEQPQICFLDADHRASALNWSVDTIMKHCPNIECIVIHDIYWSEDMNSAWKAFINDRRFNVTLDIFQAGLLFPKIEMPKQHFTVHF
ncbi:MAG: class I SAM-dependent methyltransferase, partial [Bacteroidota bacterium]